MHQGNGILIYSAMEFGVGTETVVFILGLGLKHLKEKLRGILLSIRI